RQPDPWPVMLELEVDRIKELVLDLVDVCIVLVFDTERDILNLGMHPFRHFILDLLKVGDHAVVLIAFKMIGAARVTLWTGKGQCSKRGKDRFIVPYL